MIFRSTPIRSLISVTVEGTGDVAIPDVFADDYRQLTAALDWARYFSTRRDRSASLALEKELFAAARHARNIAAKCEHFARVAYDHRVD